MSPLLFGLLVALVGVLVVVLLVRTSKERVVAIVVDIPLGGIGRVTINTDREVARLAHQAWIELITRKAGLPLDEDNDVIEEVFNSWYELFRELRTIARAVPSSSLRTANARQLLDTLVKALNGGLRPALTRWQARFRAWYAAERQARPADQPQEIQRDFPQYADMMSDLKTVNEQLMQFATALHTIAQRTAQKSEK
jgi:hypothetical protein